MKAITICQPYAHLIATGQKFVENRSWSTRHTRWLAIHAGKSRKYLESWHPEPGRPVGNKGTREPGNEDLIPYSLDPSIPVSAANLPFGAIVAVAWLTTCLRLSEIDAFAGFHPKYAWLQNHEHVEGPYCWVFSRVVPLTTPIEINGAMSLWTVPKGVVAKMRANCSGKSWRPGRAALAVEG